MNWLLQSIFLLILLDCSFCTPIYKKHAEPLSSNPIERAKFIPPSPWKAAISSSSTVYRVFLKPDAWETHLLVWQTAILVDSHERFVLTIISPLENKLGVTFVNPNGQVINLDKIRVEGTMPFGHTHFIANSYVLESPLTGSYRILFEVPAEISKTLNFPPSNVPNALLICYNKSRYRLQTYFSSYEFIAGNRIGIIARMFEAKNSTFSDDIQSYLPPPITIPSDIVTSVNLMVKYPNGKLKEISLSDDASHLEDEVANDKIYGGGLKLSEEGEYAVQVLVRGVTPEGADFTRSTQHVFPVIKKEAKIVPSARAYLDGRNIRIEIEVSGDSSKLFRISSEVWLHQSNETTPSCWLSEYVNIKKTPKHSFFYAAVHLDLRWTKPNAIVVLRNVYLQDLETNIITGVCTQIILHETKQILAEVREVSSRSNTLAEPAQKVQTPIVFIPDQYAERNPFKINSDKFPKNSQFFRSSKICHSVHSYAETVAKFVEKTQNFSVVAHAFGGLAAVHLYNYYWTGLDNVTSDKLIQVVNSAFQGSPAAGTLAMIGQMYQMTCKFFPFSPENAALWLLGISDQTRSKVVTYSSHHAIAPNEYCCLPMSSLLASPNDGVVEFSKAQLPGANKTFYKEGLCHTWNMKYGAHFSDMSLIEDLL